MSLQRKGALEIGVIENDLLNLNNKNGQQPSQPFIISDVINKSKRVLRRSISLQEKLNN